MPRLNYGLERVLYNPGVHWLRDLRTNVYNFDPFLRELPKTEDFNFANIPPFMPASTDPFLHQMAMKEGCSFVTSTSSISQSMATIYFALSKMRPLSLDSLSQPFSEEPNNYTQLTRSPSAVILKPHGSSIRSIVIEKTEDPQRENVLTKMGQIMERLLVESKTNFLKMLKSSDTRPQHRPVESYAYTVMDKILLRSQLDCHDPNLPRHTFDLKTRAVLPVRMDLNNYHSYRDYRILTNTGLYCSFEREYYDMCRSAFLKYNFQVRIGDMDGIFVAYHNVFEIFGFQYVSRAEMDERIYGNSTTGDAAFNLILQIYNAILDEIVPLYPATSTLRLTFSVDKVGNRLVVFAEDCGVDGQEAGKDIRQFVISINSMLNGFRTDQILLDNNDRWSVTLAIAQTEASMTEYDSARSKITMLRTEDEIQEGGKEAKFIQMINEKTRGLGVPPAFRPGVPDIIAPWTIL